MPLSWLKLYMPFQVLFLYHFCFLLNFYDFLWWCNCLLLYLPLLTFFNFFSASAFWKREWAFCILQKRLDIIGLCNFYILFFKDAIDFVLSFTRCILRNSIFFCLRVCVCVCVCVCMCVCVYIPSPWRLLPSAKCPRHTWGYGSAILCCEY